MFRIVAISLCLFSLSGCLTPEQIAYNRQMEAQRQDQARAEYREALLSECDSMGFSRGTDAHANCVLKQHQQNMQLLGAAALQQSQQQQQQQLLRQQQQQRKPTQTNCTRDYFGNYSCTTY